MKKLLMISAIFLATGPIALAASKMDWSGFIQTTLESGEGSSSDMTGRGPKFDVDEARITSKFSMGKTMGVIQFDVGESDGGAGRLKDGYLSYMYNDMLRVRMGKFKVPLGLDWTMGITDLDIVERNTAYLANVYMRNTGVMISGDLMMNLTYDLGYFNPMAAGRDGTDSVMAARVGFDHGDLHVEASYGTETHKDRSDQQDTPDPANVRNNRSTKAFAATYMMGKWSFKAEYMMGSNVYLADSFTHGDLNTWYLHAGYKLMRNLEVVVRHYNSSFERTSSLLPPPRTTADSAQDTRLRYQDSSLSNTYLGVNIMPEKNVRFRLNYVLVGGNDRETATPTGYGTGGEGPFVAGGRTANTFLAMAQIMF